MVSLSRKLRFPRSTPVPREGSQTLHKRPVSLTFFLNELMKQARFAGSRIPDDQEFKQEI